MTNQASSNNKRIAKNTLFLYFRMLFMMLISLYTNRIVLDKLGVTDFGIYNVVGGIVVMLGFLSGCMSNSVQRYLSYEIGRGDKDRVSRVFNVSIMVHVCIAVLVLIVMECGGLWYLNNYINIPASRMNAANWAFQCSLIATLVTILQVPYNAIIISKEKMDVFAYISILEATFKLLIVYALAISAFDKLKLYSVLMAVVTLGVLLMYQLYCKNQFVETKLRFTKDWALFKELVSFSGWNMLSDVAWTFTGPGVNLILNSFYGPVVNAARGLAEQVNSAVSRFVANFQTAVNPQLIKLYATDEIQEMKQLLFRSTRYSFFLLYGLSLPLILEMDYVLHLWLKEVPQYTTEFCQLILVCSLVSVTSTLLPRIAWAYGKIKKYQIVVSTVLFLNFPLSYFVLLMGMSPLATVYVAIAIQAVVIWVRLYLVGQMVDLPQMQYFKEVLLRVLAVTAVSLVLPLIVQHFVSDNFFGFVCVATVSVLSVCVSSYFVGMNKDERAFIRNFINKRLHKGHC